MLAISVSTHRRDGIATVSVTGELDLAAGEVVAQAIGQAVTASGTSAVIVDLSALAFVDSSGISVLLKGRREADRTGVAYRITGATGIVEQILSLTGVLQHLSDPDGTRSA